MPTSRKPGVTTFGCMTFLLIVRSKMIAKKDAQLKKDSGAGKLALQLGAKVDDSQLKMRCLAAAQALKVGRCSAFGLQTPQHNFASTPSECFVLDDEDGSAEEIRTLWFRELQSMSFWRNLITLSTILSIPNRSWFTSASPLCLTMSDLH